MKEIQPECFCQPDFSPLLFDFMARFKFNMKNLNVVNSNGVTPLTTAIDLNQQDIFLELLLLKANPLIENTHGNTALSLSYDKPFYLKKIQQAIKDNTQRTLDCQVNKYFFYDNKKFIITRILHEGSCSLVAFELLDANNLDKYFAKIKINFGGLEVRNYILLNNYVDLFMIHKLNIYDLQNKIYRVCEHVYCMIQKLIPGKPLSVALNNLESLENQAQVVVAAITALSNLHNKGFIHNDALPNNCFWDEETKTASFIDYDVMRIYEDLVKQDDDYLAQVKYFDFERLIFGDLIMLNDNKTITYGLSRYVQNINNILEGLDSTVIDPKIKNKLLYCYK